MATTLTAGEIRKMQRDDLLSEVTTKRGEIAKMRLGIEMGSHKDTAAYRRAKKELARMLTVLEETPKGETKTLKPARKASKVAAPRASSHS